MMSEDSRVSSTREQLLADLTELRSRREELLREKAIYRRLGFSRDRLNLLLRQVESRQARCEEQIKAFRGQERAQPGFKPVEPELRSRLVT